VDTPRREWASSATRRSLIGPVKAGVVKVSKYGLNVHRRQLTRIEGMSLTEKKKDLTDNEGDIREERDPKPIPASQDVEEAEEFEDKEGNLPPAMPPGV
jgi:hypothetical protein